MTVSDNHLALWEVRFSWYNKDYRYRCNGRQWVLGTDAATAMRLVTEAQQREALEVHVVQKRTGDLYGDSKLIIDWPTIDTLRADAAELGRRLRSGELEVLVRDYLAARPGERFGPGAIGKTLGRSQGAVFKALAKMAARGEVVLVSDNPSRYQIAT